MKVVSAVPRERETSTDAKRSPTPSGTPAPQTAALLALQRAAGNRTALTAMRRQGPTTGAGQSNRGEVRPAAPSRRPAAAGRPVIQRHGSPEHLMLGQVNPKDLRVIADARDGARIAVDRGENPTVARQNALHVLIQERDRSRAWQRKEPTAVDQVVDPQWQVRLVKVVPTEAPSGAGARKEVVCTYGEMNMLADYFGSVEEMKAVSPDTLWKVLQTEREDYFYTLGSLVGELAGSMFVEKDVKGWFSTSKVKFYLPPEKLLMPNPQPADFTETEPVGIATPDFEGSSRFKNAVGLNKKLNDASMLGFESLPTSTGVLSEDKGLKSFYGPGKGTGSAWGVTARNACHFAPESWRTWERYHKEAIDLAERAAQMRNVAAADTNTAEERKAKLAMAAELENDAWVTNGFGDHYLQDSFASGHLIDKTRVMQWFTDHLKTYNEVPGDRTRLSQMEVGAQPGLAPTNYSKDLGVASHNPQAAANLPSAAQAWGALGLQSIQVSPMARSVFAAWRLAPGPEAGIQPAHLLALDRSSLPADAPFPTSVEEADAALQELARRGLCEMSELGEGKDALRLFSIHDADRPSGAAQESKSQPGMNSPDAAVQTATSNMYHEWLNNSLVQAGAGALHDHFCVQGLWVGSEAAGDELFKIYGDYALLAGGGGRGAEYAAETAQMSQQNIQAVLTGARPPDGARAAGIKAIMARFPDRAVPKFKAVDLAAKAGLGGAIDVSEFNPPNVAPLRLDQWHEELERYAKGTYLKTLFDTWSHSYVSRMPGLGELTSISTVSPHSGAEF